MLLPFRSSLLRVNKQRVGVDSYILPKPNRLGNGGGSHAVDTASQANTPDTSAGTAEHQACTQCKEKRRLLTEMRYHIKERAWSLPEEFIVRDGEGSAVFEVRGAFVNIDDDLVLIDRFTSQELARAHIRQHVPTLTLRCEIYRNDQLWAHLHDRFWLFHEDFEIEPCDGSAMRIKGDTRRWSFSIIDETGQPLAHVGHEYSKFPDSYAIEVAEHVDEVAIVALVIVIDMVRERKEQSPA